MKTILRTFAPFCIAALTGCGGGGEGAELPRRRTTSRRSLPPSRLLSRPPRPSPSRRLPRQSRPLSQRPPRHRRRRPRQSRATRPPSPPQASTPAPVTPPTLPQALQEDLGGRQALQAFVRLLQASPAPASTPSEGENTPAPAVEPAPAPAPVVEAPPAPAPAPTEDAPPVRSLHEAAREAAVAEPKLGSLHMSSAPGFVKLEGFRILDEGPDDDPERRYFDEICLVDLDHDGEPERKLTAAGDHRRLPEGAMGWDTPGCSPGRSRPGRSSTYTHCNGGVGSPDRFLLYVWRHWIEEGLYGENQPRYETTRVYWADRESGHVGVFWAGESVNRPRPLDRPIHGSAVMWASGLGLLPNGDLVAASANGLLTMHVQNQLVRLSVGDAWVSPDGIPQGIFAIEDSGSYGFQIHDRFVFEERYDPKSAYFGVGEQQRSRENDVVSGNARGQFSGVITTSPVRYYLDSSRVHTATHPGALEVLGALGLTDVKGHEGLSLLMYWHTQFHPNFSWDPDEERPIGPVFPPYFGGPDDPPGDGEKTGAG